MARDYCNDSHAPLQNYTEATDLDIIKPFFERLISLPEKDTQPMQRIVVMQAIPLRIKRDFESNFDSIFNVFSKTRLGGTLLAGTSSFIDTSLLTNVAEKYFPTFIETIDQSNA